MAEARDLSRKAAERKRTGKDKKPPQPPRLSLRDGYSLFVGTMKLVLPALAVAIILLVIVWPQVVPSPGSFRIGLSELAPEEVDNLHMVNARFRGRDEQGRPFTVLADTATQDSSGANEVQLTQPQADITLEDGAWLTVSSKDGTYWRDSETLRLIGNVNLFHDQGFEMQTEAADVDLKAGKATSDRPVDGQGPSGTLTAEGFTVLNKGERILFTGKSHMTIYEKDGKDGQ